MIIENSATGESRWKRETRHSSSRRPRERISSRQFGWREAEYRSAMEEAQRLNREMSMMWLWRFLARFYPAKRREFSRMSGFVLLERAPAYGEAHAMAAAFDSRYQFHQREMVFRRSLKTMLDGPVRSAHRPVGLSCPLSYGIRGPTPPTARKSLWCRS